jgi:hypothetical protein
MIETVPSLDYGDIVARMGLVVALERSTFIARSISEGDDEMGQIHAVKPRTVSVGQ